MPKSRKVVTIVRDEPDEGLVNLLKRLLADAESGKLVGLIGIGRYKGESFAECLTPSMTNEFKLLTLAHLRVLQMRVESKIEM